MLNAVVYGTAACAGNWVYQWMRKGCMCGGGCIQHYSRGEVGYIGTV